MKVLKDPDFLYAAPDMTACAAFCKESRMKFASATKFDRKSGVAEWRDLRFLFPRTHTDSSVLGYSEPSLRNCAGRRGPLSADSPRPEQPLAPPPVTAYRLAIAIWLEMRQICEDSPSLATKCYGMNLLGESKHQIA